MTDARRLAQEILTYLRFYRDIGIDWLRPVASPATSRPGSESRARSPFFPAARSGEIFEQNIFTTAIYVRDYCHACRKPGGNP